MSSNPFGEFQRRLNLARNGGGILFCGAGFSADCLNFTPDETLGTGAQLLNLFNAELSQNPPYKRLKNAADALWEKLQDYGMLQLLKKRFKVSNVTVDMTDLLIYPWQTIYTTNYDNALEMAAYAAGKQAEPLNNTDAPDTATRSVPIIHLHGYTEKWDVHNIRDSCVLGAESYSKLTHVKKWLRRFRNDIDKAQIVVFVGFNAEDFHLNEAINDLTGLREKAFFINRPAADADPDVTAAQKRLGTPFFIGRAGLAQRVRELLIEDAPKEPRLVSFVKYAPPAPALTVPTKTQIENLFLFNDVDFSQIARDISENVSQYHVQRSTTQDAFAAIANNARVLLFDGYPCDGKTLIANDLYYRLSGTRPVYFMKQAYESILDEVANILLYAPNATIIIENCFDMPPARLVSIARQFDGQQGILILTSRAIAVDASPVGLASLKNFGSFWHRSLTSLNDVEAGALSELTDQITGWRNFHELDAGAQLRFIRDTCKASLPHFLMRLLQSEYVTDRYRQEFNKLSLSERQRSAVVIALYISHIGENATVSALSNAMGTDFGSIIDGLNSGVGGDTFRLVRRRGEVIQTVPSIGAENILKSLFSDAEIIDALIPLLKNLAGGSRSNFEQRIFTQMMRFSILSTVVADKKEIDRFFENNKQELQIRRMPLFWLQWHMAKCDSEEFSDAEEFLVQGYAEADEFERRQNKKFDRRQLDDRRAKFLMLRVEKTSRTGASLFGHLHQPLALSDFGRWQADLA